MSTFEEDMKQMEKQVTAEVIFHINKTPELYKSIADITTMGLSTDASIDAMTNIVYDWSETHDNEFGTVFEAELDAVNWVKVASSI